MIQRVNNLALMPKDRRLIPVTHILKFSQVKKLIRSGDTIYYFRRRFKFPPLLFKEGETLPEFQKKEGKDETEPERTDVP